LDRNINAFLSATTVSAIRIVAVKYGLHLPVIGG